MNELLFFKYSVSAAMEREMVWTNMQRHMGIIIILLVIDLHHEGGCWA